MELRTLRYFLTVAREGSISAAAEALHLTQPTLSRQLTELETELGAQLFLRGRRNRGLELTEQGLLLRQRASELLELARQHAYDADPTLTGSIITHLLRHGVTEPILSWQDCPTRFFCGRYSMNGLRLIQALKDNNQIEVAQKLLAIMQNEAHYPATRLAAAVLADNPEQKKSCIRDALLLSMLWYIADEQIYRECKNTHNWS